MHSMDQHSKLSGSGDESLPNSRKGRQEIVSHAINQFPKAFERLETQSEGLTRMLLGRRKRIVRAESVKSLFHKIHIFEVTRKTERLEKLPREELISKVSSARKNILVTGYCLCILTERFDEEALMEIRRQSSDPDVRKMVRICELDLLEKSREASLIDKINQIEESIKDVENREIGGESEEKDRKTLCERIEMIKDLRKLITLYDSGSYDAKDLLDHALDVKDVWMISYVAYILYQNKKLSAMDLLNLGLKKVVAETEPSAQKDCLTRFSQIVDGLNTQMEREAIKEDYEGYD